MSTVESLIALVYIIFGMLGVFCNLAIVAMLLFNSIYRLSAYTLMANVALADSLILLVAGCYCGSAILVRNDLLPSVFLQHVTGFVLISSLVAGSISYVFLGVNRCIAIRYYRTKVRNLNQVRVAVCCVLFAWVIGFAIATWGIVSSPMVVFRRNLWTITFVSLGGARPWTFLGGSATTHGVCIAIQWICSFLVLQKIRTVRRRISRKKLKRKSVKRFTKQTRLTFQFFYPSSMCTLSSLIYFAKPFIGPYLVDYQLILLHCIWLINHMSNPFIYAYFNDRMRHSYSEWFLCDRFKSTKFNRVKTRTDRDFVRTSLQFQSRNFEQLCHFIVQTNPMRDDSECWNESSAGEEEEEEENANVECNFETNDRKFENMNTLTAFRMG